MGQTGRGDMIPIAVGTRLHDCCERNSIPRTIYIFETGFEATIFLHLKNEFHWAMHYSDLLPDKLGSQ